MQGIKRNSPEQHHKCVPSDGAVWWLRLAWHLPSSDLFLSRKTRPKCVQWCARCMPLKQFALSLSSSFLSPNVTIFHLQSLSTWLKEHLHDLLSWHRRSLPCLHAASMAVPGELEAGDALSSLLCPLALSLSDVLFVKRPGQGIMLYIFKEKHADNRVLAKCVLLNETCWGIHATVMPVWLPWPRGTEPWLLGPSGGLWATAGASGQGQEFSGLPCSESRPRLRAPRYLCESKAGNRGKKGGQHWSFLFQRLKRGPSLFLPEWELANSAL